MNLKKEVVTVLGICIFAGLFVSYLYLPTVDILNWGKKDSLPKEAYKAPTLNLSDCEAFKRNLKQNYWSKLNLQALDIPAVIKAQASSIKVKSSKVSVKDTSVHYLYIKPETSKTDKISVLLLHGQAFSSLNWKNIGTIQILGALGYHVVAVDLPGYGESPKAEIEDKGAFLGNMIKALQIAKPVIVSPSMSGAFSVPYVANEWENVAGYVPVSPVGTKLLEEKDFCGSHKGSCSVVMDETCKSLLDYLRNQDPPSLCCVQVPTIVVFGEHDRGSSSARLCHLPWSQGVEIPEGKHAAYLKDPDLWHKILYNFLLEVEVIDLCR